MKYSVKFPTASIEKKFDKAMEDIKDEHLRDEIARKVLALGNDPRPHGVPKIKPPIPVYNYTAQYRIRIGDHRVLYDVDDRSKTVWVFALRKRNEGTYR